MTRIDITFTLYQTLKEAIVDVHNELRKKVAKGEEKRGLVGTAAPKQNKTENAVFTPTLPALHIRLNC